MPKKRSDGFGESFNEGFKVMAHDVMLQTLRELAQQPERQSQIEFRKHQMSSDFLTPQEQAAIEKEYPTLTPGSLSGVRRTVIDALLPRQYTDMGTGKVIEVGPRGKALPPAPVAVDPDTGQTASLPRGARIVQAPGAAEAKRSIGILRSFKSTFSEYSSLLDKIPSGRIAGGGADLLNKYTGMFPEAKAARALEGVMTPMAARILGGDVGNLNENEQKRVRDAVAMMNGTIKERKQGSKMLLELLEKKEQEVQGQTSAGMFKSNQKQLTTPRQQQYQQGAASSGGSDPLGIR